MKYLIISLDGNIGAGKSTLLSSVRTHMPDIHVVDEPVGQWTQLKNAKGENLLQLFYQDKKRWAYTFQNCAIWSRLKNIKDAVENLDPTVKGPHVILTERSVLTDKHVFAEMLRDAGDMDLLEWELYESWFNIFSKQYPVSGIIYLSTGSITSNDRIHVRNRPEEKTIPIEYLDALDTQHKKWLQNTTIPVLTLSTEPGSSVEENLKQIREYVDRLKQSA